MELVTIKHSSTLIHQRATAAIKKQGSIIEENIIWKGESSPSKQVLTRENHSKQHYC